MKNPDVDVDLPAGEYLDPATLLCFEADYRAEIQRAMRLEDGRLWLELADHEVVTEGPAEVCAGVINTLLSFPPVEAVQKAG